MNRSKLRRRRRKAEPAVRFTYLSVELLEDRSLLSLFAPRVVRLLRIR